MPQSSSQCGFPAEPRESRGVGEGPSPSGKQFQREGDRRVKETEAKRRPEGRDTGQNRR